ncbi:MAG: Rne/Rng family ribonuclease [Bacteroidota bacterium]
MEVKLIINSAQSGVDLAILEEGVLTELHKEKNDNSFSVGDIYLGKARKVSPNLNASFINVGHEKDGFLHYHDLGPQFSSLSKFVKRVRSGKQKSPRLDNFKLESDINKNGKINEQISNNQHIIVQVAKEPISNKGPRLTSEITFAGRFIVLVPFSNRISVSGRIKDRDEKQRLKRLIASIKPKNFGVIIRTVAENRKVAELDKDLKDLLRRWGKFHRNLQRAQPPRRVLGEINKTSAILRDLLNNDFSSIHVNNKDLALEIQNYLASIAPDKAKIVKEHSSKREIFEHFNIHKQIKAAFGKQVNLKNGGYLIIEHTEAMHVIDVNSGNRAISGQNQEQNAIETNLESAKEIARVLKLRDMGGLIVVDFIDMQKKENQMKLYNQFKGFLREDKAKSSVLRPSKFGLIEITRERVRPETEIKTTEKCPSCQGTGEIQASILLTDEIENKLDLVKNRANGGEIALCVHPYVASYITKKNGWKGLVGNSLKKEWSGKLGKKIDVREMSSYNIMEYGFFTSEDEEIEI